MATVAHIAIATDFFIWCLLIVFCNMLLIEFYLNNLSLVYAPWTQSVNWQIVREMQIFVLC
jgi:hypothetical protein